jgi:hypothetical protein
MHVSVLCGEGLEYLQRSPASRGRPQEKNENTEIWSSRGKDARLTALLCKNNNNNAAKCK